MNRNNRIIHGNKLISLRKHHRVLRNEQQKGNFFKLKNIYIKEILLMTFLN